VDIVITPNNFLYFPENVSVNQHFLNIIAYHFEPTEPLFKSLVHSVNPNVGVDAVTTVFRLNYTAFSSATLWLRLYGIPLSHALQ
jgi:hypothetical protein